MCVFFFFSFLSFRVLEATEKSLKPRRLDDGAVSSKRRHSGFYKMCCQRLTDAAVPDGHMHSETVRSPRAEQLRKWPPDAFRRRINGVCL